MLKWLKEKRDVMDSEKRIKIHIEDTYKLMDELFVNIKNQYDDDKPSGYFIDMLALYYNNPYGFILKEGCSIDFPCVIITDSIIKKKIDHPYNGSPYIFYYDNKKFEITETNEFLAITSENKEHVYCFYSFKDKKINYAERSGNKNLLEIENSLKKTQEGLYKAIYFYSKTLQLFKNTISDDDIYGFVQNYKEHKDMLVLMLPFLYKENVDIAVRLSKFCINQGLDVNKEYMQNLLLLQKEKVEGMDVFPKAKKYCNDLTNYFMEVSKDMNFFENIKMNKKLVETLVDKNDLNIVGRKNKI